VTDKPDSDATEQALVFECDLDAPPEKVWRALTERALVAQWLMPGDMRAEVGAQFQLRPAANDDGPGAREIGAREIGARDIGHGAIDCAVLECDPPHRLRLNWREGPRDARGLDSTVTFLLRAIAGGGTRLVIVHDGFAAAPDARPAPVMSAAALPMAA
jgi:uncharacterized protein YndB with AHSA1/START domain